MSLVLLNPRAAGGRAARLHGPIAAWLRVNWPGARLEAPRHPDEALELIRDGVLSNLSVGFQPLKDEKRNGVVNRLRAHLAEVSLVTFGAYGDAANIVAVRQEIEKPNLESVKDIVANLKR